MTTSYSLTLVYGNLEALQDNNITTLNPYSLVALHPGYSLIAVQPNNLTSLPYNLISSLQPNNLTSLHSLVALHPYSLIAVQPNNLTSLQPYNFHPYNLTTLQPYNLMALQYDYDVTTLQSYNPTT